MQAVSVVAEAEPLLSAAVEEEAEPLSSIAAEEKQKRYLLSQNHCRASHPRQA